MKVLVGAFNQEKALVGAFSVIVQPVMEPMEHYTALLTTHTAQVTGEEGRLTVTANWGLGESVVSGLADPDTLALDTETGAILTYNIGAKRVRWQTK